MNTMIQEYTQEGDEVIIQQPVYHPFGFAIDLEQLLTKDIYKDFVMDFKRRKTVVKALCLHIAHDCNLACKYCFAEEGEYHGRRALMSYEVGKKALDFLIDPARTAPQRPRETGEVTFRLRQYYNRKKVRSTAV